VQVTKLLFWIVLAFLVAVPLNAGLIFTLDQDGCTGGCGNTPFGTVTLNQGADANTVDVRLDLLNGNLFPGGADPNHFSLAWNLLGSPAVTITNLTPAFFVVGPTDVNQSPFGAFGYSVDCPKNECGPGASNAQPGPLTFSVFSAGGLTPDSFTANAGGFYFASDIFSAEGTRNTGNVAAIGGGTPNPHDSDTPEPASMALVGAGLIAVAVSLKKRQRTS
jgi:hypothetical protein